ncbi:hypothetical protein [Thermaerobacter subterraneus]|uniref:Transmembrane protein n=1 Tax=Thermaerobacter subterraneus DSM 13965 TaxID=867903 RepID=K6P2S1_9FIRM|nr:hypothetical protein [Thermaerobacter subterraneus]EKP95370.1 hypothetical protein ThesuDRAFT_01121 [Thermaerobacter subterraneus DSM 13965]
MRRVVRWFGVVAVLLAIIVANLAALPTVAVMVTLGLAVGIVTARARREALTVLALVWVVSAILAAWLWRAGFQRADANLPESPWTGLWWPLAAIAAGSLVTFAGVYLKQLRELDDRQH